MKKMIKILAAVLSLAMLISCVGCGDSNETAGDNEFGKKMTLSMTSNVEDPSDSASFQYIKEKFNIDFDLYYVTEANWNEKVRIWMATGSMPQIMQASIQNKNFNEYRQWAEQGLLKELPDLSKYPNLKARYDNCRVAPYFQVDGKDYTWISYAKAYNADELTNAGTYGFLYRADIAKELGMEKDVYTWEEYKELARAMKKKFAGDELFAPIVMDAGLFPYGAGMMMHSPYWEQYKLTDDGYKWALDLPETLEGIKDANAMYHEGLFPEDLPLYKSREGTNKFKIGQAGILMTNVVDYNVDDIVKSFKEAFPDKDANECIQVMKVLAPDGKGWGQYGIGFTYTTLFSKDMNDEEMDRIFQVYDWIASEEGVKMANYGVEGIDHTVVDGKIKFKNEDMSIDGVNPLWSKAMVQVNSTPMEIQLGFYGQNTIDKVADYKEYVETADNTNYRRYDYNQYFCSGENYSKYGAFFYDGSDLIKRLISEDPSIVESEWNKWKDSVRPNAEKVIAELNATLK